MNTSTSNSDIEEKISLFVMAFGDSESTAREFFSCGDVITVTKYVGKRLAAMASLIPIHAESGNVCGLEQMSKIKRKNCGYYIYGVCVAPEYRGNGLFRTIMDTAEDIAMENGADFLCLIPADESLASTYRKWGYDVEIQNTAHNFFLGRFLTLDSESFRAFAEPSENIPMDGRMRGLMKVLNKKLFAPSDCEYMFGDHMGDV